MCPCRITVAATALTAVLLAGCGSSSPNNASTQQASSAPAPSLPPGPVPTSFQQLCDSLPWPRPVPQVAGQLVSITPDSLDCWMDTLKMIAPDGHDFATSSEDLNMGRSFRVASVSPPPGTMADRHDTITVFGNILEPSEVVALPPATYPCSWLTTDEVAQALDVQAVTPSPTGDKTGEADPFCTYSFDNDYVASQLFTPASLPADAGHMFVFNTASKSDEPYTDIDGFSGPARCVSTRAGRSATPSHSLWVLLSDNRIYWIHAGLHDVPCSSLKALGQKAIQRIGA